MVEKTPNYIKTYFRLTLLHVPNLVRPVWVVKKLRWVRGVLMGYPVYVVSFLHNIISLNINIYYAYTEILCGISWVRLQTREVSSDKDVINALTLVIMKPAFDRSLFSIPLVEAPCLQVPTNHLITHYTCISLQSLSNTKLYFFR